MSSLVLLAQITKVLKICSENHNIKILNMKTFLLFTIPVEPQSHCLKSLHTLLDLFYLLSSCRNLSLGPPFHIIF